MLWNSSRIQNYLKTIKNGTRKSYKMTDGILRNIPKGSDLNIYTLDVPIADCL